MKKFLCLAGMALVVALFAVNTGTVQSASTVSKTPFANVSAASAAVKTSSVINVSGYKTKTLSISGVNLAGTAFKNMSGTVLAQCGPSDTGPWTTCVANDYGQTAISRTTNGQFTWTDASPYVRLYWTSGTKGGKLKAWLNLHEF